MIIPVLNAEQYIGRQLDSLKRQTVKPMEILVVDSESQDHTVEIANGFEGGRVIPVRRSSFDHGKTRDMALRQTEGDYVLFLTQDAEIVKNTLIEDLLRCFTDEKIAVVSARQIPRVDAGNAEKLIRQFNYPSGIRITGKADIEKRGIKAVFVSDVCAMYRKDIYLKTGGFLYPLKTNEDMFYAATVLKQGYTIVYDGNTWVRHSHNFTLKQQYDRNYIQGYEMERHADLLEGTSRTSEGMRLVKYVSKGLLEKGHFLEEFRFFLDCCARLAGSENGRKAALKGERK